MLPDLEPRLQRRYQSLVLQHVHAATPLACGLRLQPGPTTAAALSQGGWRFWHNDAVTLSALAGPLVELARGRLAAAANDYALVAHDWSTINYHRHAAKIDQVLFSTGSDRGYELYAAVLLDAVSGGPIAPLELRLSTAEAMYSTRQPAPPKAGVHLDALRPGFAALERLDLPARLVHIVDCEGDSVLHLRRWHKYGHLFLVRTDGTRTVTWRGRECRLPEVVESLLQQNAFGPARVILYKGQKARRVVAEVEVELTRPAYLNRKGKRRVVKGRPLRLRLVVSRVLGEQGELLAQWCLLSNVPAEIDGERLALWYYHRWSIETYFKLLKSAGQQLEQWKQRSGLTVARRLLVASMACALAWRAAALPGPEGEMLRDVLVRLSGRLVSNPAGFTLPALLAGLEVLLAVVRAVEQYGIQTLRQCASAAGLVTDPTSQTNPNQHPTHELYPHQDSS